ncbi:MAG: hypothetical protein HDT07_02280 [Bacteroidales bacterium]|nr:hypothetical protein [Bacteroidales bacterium]
MITPEILEQLTRIKNGRRAYTVGIPAPRLPEERRMPLTPEGASILVSDGYHVKIERNAGLPIHYDDPRYAHSGAELVTRSETLEADIVIYLGVLTTAEALRLRPGILLLTLHESAAQSTETLAILLQRQITVLALNLVADHRGNRPIADILGEIDGRAAIAISSSLLADAEHGKGILLGGVAGVNPAEVLILGSGMAALAAARSAIGLGGIVRLFDSDPYSLRDAMGELGPAIIGSALHPRVLGRALSTADIVVATSLSSPFSVADSVIDEMKRGVVIFDLTARAGISAVFPTLRCIDLATATAVQDKPMDSNSPRACYINAAGAVPRTTAMALTNELIPLIGRLVGRGQGLENALKIDSGLRPGIITYRGRVVNPRLAERLGLKVIDINLLLSFS